MYFSTETDGKIPKTRFTVTVDFKYVFPEMFRTSEFRCKVQKSIMKFKLAFDWLLYNV